MPVVWGWGVEPPGYPIGCLISPLPFHDEESLDLPEMLVSCYDGEPILLGYSSDPYVVLGNRCAVSPEGVFYGTVEF